VIILIHGIQEILKQLRRIYKTKNSNRSGGAHKSRKSDASKKQKKRWY
jgi:hypothetical protein